MVQRGAIVKDGNGYTDYALDVVQGDGSVKVGDVVEWTIINAHKGPPGLVIPQDTTHPFHLHTNHFQVVATSKGDGVDYDVGDWRDTITLPTPGNVTVRFRAADFDGPSLAHCHISRTRTWACSARSPFNPRRSRLVPLPLCNRC